MKRKSTLSLKRQKGLKFRALRKGDDLYRKGCSNNRYLAVVNGDHRVVAYVALDGLFDEYGNYFTEA